MISAECTLVLLSLAHENFALGRRISRLTGQVVFIMLNEVKPVVFVMLMISFLLSWNYYGLFFPLRGLGG